MVCCSPAFQDGKDNGLELAIKLRLMKNRVEQFRNAIGSQLEDAATKSPEDKRIVSVVQRRAVG